MLAVAEFGSEDLVSWHNDAMFSVIGGIYLVGGGAPLSVSPGVRAPQGFIGCWHRNPIAAACPGIACIGSWATTALSLRTIR